VCISSIKSIIFQFDFSTSFITAFNLSSNSHLYLAQASRAHISRVIILFHFRLSGISHSTIFLAIHSTIAVFQTPGSQIKTGLFFDLRESICRALLISSSLQITGSIFQFLASSTKSIQYFFSEFILFSESFSVTFSPHLILFILFSIFLYVIQKLEKIFLVTSSQNLNIDKNKCSSVMNSSFIFFAIISASSKTLFKSLPSLNSKFQSILGIFCSSLFMFELIVCRSIHKSRSISFTIESPLFTIE
jgi:hypothetical protein